MKLSEQVEIDWAKRVLGRARYWLEEKTRNRSWRDIFTDRPVVAPRR